MTAWLKPAMKRAGLSQAEVARLAGIDPAYLSMLLNEKRSNPSPEVVRALKSALGESSPTVGTGGDPGARALIDQLEAHFRTGLLLVDELRRKLSTGEAAV